MTKIGSKESARAQKAEWRWDKKSAQKPLSGRKWWRSERRNSLREVLLANSFALFLNQRLSWIFFLSFSFSSIVFRGILSRATLSFFRITQRNPRIEFIGISFPFNQGFLFLLVAANNFFNSKNILICLLQFCFVK